MPKNKVEVDLSRAPIRSIMLLKSKKVLRSLRGLQNLSNIPVLYESDN